MSLIGSIDTRFLGVARPLVTFLSALVLLLPGTAWSQSTAKQQGDIYTLENPRFRIEVDAAGGARIRSWTLKPSGRELIALWKHGQEVGGALDDRSFFTGLRYAAGITQPGPETAALRLEARHPSGVNVLKTLTIRKDLPALEVQYEFSNGSQAPQRLFVRNFFLPGSKPQTDEHLYWVNAEPGQKQAAVEGRADAHGYYRPARPEIAALWDRASGDGVMALAPGIEKFYLWRGSRHWPTFEWLYADVPPGNVLNAAAVLVAVSSEKSAPDWPALAKTFAARARKPLLTPLAGWVDESTRFGVSQEERERGVWLSIGSAEFKQRLPQFIPLDLPRDDDRYLSITLNMLKDFSAPARVELPPAWRGQVEPFWETPGQDRRELLPLPAGPLTFQSGSRETLWLRVNGRGKEPGEHRIPIELRIGEISLPVEVRLHVWPVPLAPHRPFHVRGYCGGFAVLTGGYEIDDQKLRRLDALLRAYAEMGGDVLDWTCNWGPILAKTKIAGTDQCVADVAKRAPQRLDLNRLPQLDFSYFDPWLKLCHRHGVTRFETYMSFPNDSRLQGATLDAAVGKGRAILGTPEADRVIVWLYRELHRYAQSKAFDGLFCKIADEISPEHIPPYIDAAKLARQAGWRPFTTITGMIARTAEDVRAMNPYCDQWQLGFGSKDAFLRLTQMKFELQDRQFELRGPWGPYHNGGAQEMWGMRVFGERGQAAVNPADIERFELLEDGRALDIKGGSPWGKRQRGTVFTAGALKEVLYVSPRDGADPKNHRYLLQVKLRHESAAGKPLIELDSTDELWCYGGSSRPYLGTYDRAWVYPAMTLYHNLRGYGQWAFFHWHKTENIIWIDAESLRVTISPAYCGYRDGWRDALLLERLIDRCSRQAYERIVGAETGCILQVGSEINEVYAYTTLRNAGDPLAINAARRAALEQLAAARQDAAFR